MHTFLFKKGKQKQNMHKNQPERKFLEITIIIIILITTIHILRDLYFAHQLRR